MIDESAANTDIICRKIESNVALSFAPSNPAKKVFKSKSILKPKAQRRLAKPNRNKENKNSNGKLDDGAAKNVGRAVKKPRSMIPKPTKRDNVFKTINDQKERDRSNVSKMGSRKGSISKIPKIESDKSVSKTEVLYQRARAAMSKLNAPPPPVPKPKKSSSKVKEVAKPPLCKRKSQAVIEVINKQKQIRKNFIENRGSFQHTSTRNQKHMHQTKENKSMRSSQERVEHNKLLPRSKPGKFSTHFDDFCL